MAIIRKKNSDQRSTKPVTAITTIKQQSNPIIPIIANYNQLNQNTHTWFDSRVNYINSISSLAKSRRKTAMELADTLLFSRAIEKIGNMVASLPISIDSTATNR